MSALHLPKAFEHISHDLKECDPGALIVLAIGSLLLILILSAFFYH